MSIAFALRPYRSEDFEATVALWREAWDAAIPEIDFSERLPWWRKRWENEVVPNNTITVAEAGNRVAGFTVIDPRSGYLDQIVVAPEFWGSSLGGLLLDEAKRASPARIMLYVNQDNPRAIRFYEREGFVRADAGTNPFSGRPTWRYVWKPG